MPKNNAYAKVFKILGSRYRARRKQLGIKHREIEDYGINARLYQYIEAGKPHNLKTLFRISKMLKVSPESLLEGITI